MLLGEFNLSDSTLTLNFGTATVTHFNPDANETTTVTLKKGDQVVATSESVDVVNEQALSVTFNTVDKTKLAVGDNELTIEYSNKLIASPTSATLTIAGPDVDAVNKTIKVGSKVLTVGEYGTYETAVALDAVNDLLTITSNGITLTMAASNYRGDGSNTFTINSDETAVIVVDGVAQTVEGTDSKTVDVAANGTIIIALKGDFTGGGEVDEIDAQQILRAAVESSYLAGFEDAEIKTAVCDIVTDDPGSEGLDEIDAQQILRAAVEASYSLNW